jgi:hypothetical protein
MAVIPLPLYSPDLVPCELFLIQKVKLKLKGHWFDTTEEIQAESQRVLDTLTEKDFQEAFQKWKRRVANRPYGEFYDFYIVSPE